MQSQLIRLSQPRSLSTNTHSVTLVRTRFLSSSSNSFSSHDYHASSPTLTYLVLLIITGHLCRYKLSPNPSLNYRNTQTTRNANDNKETSQHKDTLK